MLVNIHSSNVKLPAVGPAGLKLLPTHKQRSLKKGGHSGKNTKTLGAEIKAKISLYLKLGWKTTVVKQLCLRLNQT